MSMEFSRPEYWSGLPCPPQGDLPNPGSKLRSPMFQADSLPSESPGKPKNTGVDSLSLLQGIFPTQGSRALQADSLPAELPGKADQIKKNLKCHAKLLQSYPTLCDPMDFSPPASSVHGILRARILEWVTMPSSRESSRPRDGILTS